MVRFSKKIFVHSPIFMLIFLLTACHPFSSASSQVFQKPILYEFENPDGDIATLSLTRAGDGSSCLLLEHLLRELYGLESSSQDGQITYNPNDSVSFSLKTLDENQNITYYTMALDFDHKSGKISSDNKSLSFSEDTFNALLSSNVFSDFYTFTTAPTISLSLEETDLSPTVDYSLSTKISQDYTYIQATSSSALPVTTTLQNLEKDTAISLSLLDTEKNLAIHYQYRTLMPSDSSSSQTATLMSDASSDVLVDGNVNVSNPQVPLPGKNGLYQLDITYTWTDDSESVSSYLVQHLNLDLTYLETYSLNEDSYEPGDLVVIQSPSIDDQATYTFTTDIYHETLTWEENDDNYYILLPLMSRLSPGDYSFTITKTDSDSTTSSTTLTIHVLDKDFPVQYLTTSSSTASVKTAEAYEELYAAFARGRENLSTEKLWDGAFLQPVGGRVSTEYGAIRYTNGSSTSSRHSGIDFANPEGTEVMATQNGYVTLSEELTITGNTIFIDHGLGILSQYYHLSELLVDVGDYVTKGQIIGKVGSTGFSTGPHLHFSIYDNGVYLNPWKFFESSPF